MMKNPHVLYVLVDYIQLDQEIIYLDKLSLWMKIGQIKEVTNSEYTGIYATLTVADW